MDRRPHTFPRPAILLAGLWVLAVAAAPLLGASVGGSVTRATDGAPIGGADVTVSGGDAAPVSGTTGADGRFSVTVPGGGPFAVGVRADGYSGQAVGDASPGSPVAFALSASPYRPLPAFLGDSQAVLADPAISGVFYSVGTRGPEIHRTTDHGGLWRSSTMSYDDPCTGSAAATCGSSPRRARSAARSPSLPWASP